VNKRKKKLKNPVPNLKKKVKKRKWGGGGGNLSPASPEFLLERKRKEFK
jgi:hypothetical protein